MSWDDDDVEWDAPSNDNDNDKAEAPTLTDKWDGEDEDEDTLLGDDWDADPEEKKKAAESKVVPGVKKLTKRQLAKKKEEEERQAALKRAAHIKAEADDPEAAAKRKAAIRAEIEKSNAMLTVDLFGGEGYEAPEEGEFQDDQLDADNTDMISDMAAADIKKLKVKTEDPLENLELKTVEDFKKLATKVAGLVTKPGQNKSLVEFAKQLLTEATTKLSLDQCTEIKKCATVICTKKQKAEAGKKKKGNKKAQLSMSRQDDLFDGDAGYDDGMDDFL